MHLQSSYVAEPVIRTISENGIERNLRILIDLLQFERKLRHVKLSSLALGQRRCAHAQGEWELFLVQTNAFWDGGQQFDFGGNVGGDRVRIVLETRCLASRGD